MATNKINNRADWIFDNIGFDIDKTKLIRQYIQYMLNRTYQIFDYENLPETITKRDIESLYQIKGYCFIKDVNDKLYALDGSLGGLLNQNMLPTKAIITNPYLNYNATLDIDKECVWCINDSAFIGLMPMFNKYATLLAETDISLKLGCINARIPSLIVADNDSAKESANEYLKKVANGELGIIASKPFFDGIKTNDYSSKSNTNIKDLIELQQYLKSNWFIELGLNANYNMKRESINESESAMNDDCLLPLIDDMLECRKINMDKVNKMYGTNIVVKLNSSWQEIHQEYHEESDIEDDNVIDDKKGGDDDETT